MEPKWTYLYSTFTPSLSHVGDLEDLTILCDVTIILRCHLQNSMEAIRCNRPSAELREIRAHERVFSDIIGSPFLY